MIVSVLVMAACEKIVDYPTESDGRIYVSAVLGKKGENVITLDVSQPVNGAENSTVADVSLSLEADGKPVRLERKTEDSYLVMDDLLPGQKLRLAAQADGLPAVKAFTMVPYSLPGVEVQSELRELYKTKDAGQVTDKLISVRELSVIIDEGPTDDSYFGVQVERRLVYDTLGTVDPRRWEEYEKYHKSVIIDELYVNGQFGESNSVGLVDIEVLVEYDGGDMRLMPAVAHGDGSLVQVYVEPARRRIQESIHNSWMNEHWEIYRDYEYRLKLYRLSPELYHCLRTKYMVDASKLPVYMGFTPVTYIYTNVEGGLGFFGAVSSYETEWFRTESL